MFIVHLKNNHQKNFDFKFLVLDFGRVEPVFKNMYKFMYVKKLYSKQSSSIWQLSLFKWKIVYPEFLIVLEYVMERPQPIVLVLVVEQP